MDHDPLVTAHGRALMSTGTGPIDWFEADLTYPDEVIDQARGCLDLRRPVAVSACAVVDDIADHERSVAALAQIMAVTVPGSYLLMTGIAGDLDPDGVVEASLAAVARCGLRWYPRTTTQVQDYLTDLDVLDWRVYTRQSWIDHQDFVSAVRRWGGPVALGHLWPLPYTVLGSQTRCDGEPRLLFIPHRGGYDLYMRKGCW